MTLFEFIVGMISITMALAVAQIFVGITQLMQSRAQVKFFLPQLIWMATLFLITFLHWWSLWTFRDLSWNFAMFFFSLVGPSLLFFQATMLNPQNVGAGPIDVQTHFMNIRRPFMTVFLVMLVMFTVDGPLFGTEPLMNPLRIAQIAVIAMSFWALISDSPKVQLFVSLAIFVSVVIIAIIRFLPGNQ